MILKSSPSLFLIDAKYIVKFDFCDLKKMNSSLDYEIFNIFTYSKIIHLMIKEINQINQSLIDQFTETLTRAWEFRI